MSLSVKVLQNVLTVGHLVFSVIITMPVCRASKHILSEKWVKTALLEVDSKLIYEN